MAVPIPGAAFIISAYSTIARNMARISDIAEFQFDVMDANAGTVFSAAKNYRRELRQDMDLAWNKYQAAGNFEKKVTYNDLNATMLRAVSGDKDQFIQLYKGRGLTNQEIENIYEGLTSDNVSLNALDGKYDPNSKEARIAENIKHLMFDMPVYDMEKIITKRRETYEMIKDNPNYSKEIKDFFKPTMIDNVDFQKIVQGARDMQLCDVMEDRRNRHESDLGYLNAYNALRGNMMGEYEDSTIRYLGSMHSQLFKDKRQALRLLPVGAENKQKFKDELKKVIEEMREAHDKNGNSKSRKFWGKMTPDDFIERFESEEFINKLTNAGKEYMELVEKGAEIHMLKPHQTLGQTIWSMWVNSADANLFAGESQTSLHTKIYHKKAMKAGDEELVFLANQWFKDGDYPWIDRTESLRLPKLENDISELVLVKNIRSYFSDEENRKFIEEEYGYVFDYDGKNPETVSLEDLYFIDRKAKEIYLMEHKNPARTFGAEKIGGSLQTFSDKHAFIRGSLEFRIPRSLSGINKGNIPGQEIKYKTTPIRDEDGEIMLNDDGSPILRLIGGGKSYAPEQVEAANNDPEVTSALDELNNRARRRRTWARRSIEQADNLEENEIPELEHQISSYEKERNYFNDLVTQTDERINKESKLIEERKEIFSKERDEDKESEEEYAEKIKKVRRVIDEGIERVEALQEQNTQNQEVIDNISSEIEGLERQARELKSESTRLRENARRNIERAEALEAKAGRIEIKKGNPVIDYINRETQNVKFKVNKLLVKTYEGLANLTNHIASETGGASPVNIRNQIRGFIDVWDVPGKKPAREGRHWSYSREPVADPVGWDYEYVEIGDGKEKSSQRIYENTLRLNQGQNLAQVDHINKLDDIGPKALKKSAAQAAYMMYDYVKNYARASINSVGNISIKDIAKTTLAPVIMPVDQVAGRIRASAKGERYKPMVTWRQVALGLLTTTAIGLVIRAVVNAYSSEKTHKTINLDNDPELKSRLESKANDENTLTVAFDRASALEYSEGYSISLTDTVMLNESKAFVPKTDGISVIPEDGMEMKYEQAPGGITVESVKTEDGTVTFRKNGRNFEVSTEGTKFGIIGSSNDSNQEASTEENTVLPPSQSYEQYFEVTDTAESRRISEVISGVEGNRITENSDTVFLDTDVRTVINVDGIVIRLEENITIINASRITRLDDEDKTVEKVETQPGNGEIRFIDSRGSLKTVNLKDIQQGQNKDNSIGYNPSEKPKLKGFEHFSAQEAISVGKQTYLG
jgi:hypothetical protein